MSGYPSIGDLFKKTTTPARPGVLDDSAKKEKKLPGDESVESKFAHKMHEIDIKEKESVTAAQAQLQGVPYIDLAQFPISSEALRALPQEMAEKNQAVCFFYNGEQLRLGAVEINNDVRELVSQLAEKFQVETQVYLISNFSFERVVKLYANLPIVKPVSKEIVITDEELQHFGEGIKNLAHLQEQFKHVTISNILILLIASALKVNASDVHVEAEEKGTVVRYRIDGVLQDVALFPKEQWKKFVARIKLLAALKINITDRPQDGRVTLRLSSGTLDVRVSTLPTTWGESVVMRILHSGSKGVTYDELGLRGSAYLKLKKEVERPNGMVITTGPTGSGKTTTMYAILRTLNKTGVKIITLEDPVEIKMDGINQSQVDPNHDYTFAKGLRSILRQDPDICMVGEIRDLETAEISIQMALTGHLMLSTIHTNSASGAIPRFLSMGVKPFLLAPALNSIIGQRLVRKICDFCKVKVTLEPEVFGRVTSILQTLPQDEKSNYTINENSFSKGNGCDECSGLGYKGRIGIYEIFVMNKEIEAIVLGDAVSEYAIQELAVKQGMITMAQDGLLKAADGITTVDEVFRVTE